MKKKIFYLSCSLAVAGIAVVFSCRTSVDFVPEADMPAGAYALLMPEPVERKISLGIISFRWHDGGERIVFAADSPHTEYFLFGAARRNYKLKLALPQDAEDRIYEAEFIPAEVSTITLLPTGLSVHLE